MEDYFCLFVGSTHCNGAQITVDSLKLLFTDFTPYNQNSDNREQDNRDIVGCKRSVSSVINDTQKIRRKSYPSFPSCSDRSKMTERVVTVLKKIFTSFMESTIRSIVEQSDSDFITASEMMIQLEEARKERIRTEFYSLQIQAAYRMFTGQDKQVNKEDSYQIWPPSQGTNCQVGHQQSYINPYQVGDNKNSFPQESNQAVDYSNQIHHQGNVYPTYVFPSLRGSVEDEELINNQAETSETIFSEPDNSSSSEPGASPSKTMC